MSARRRPSLRLRHLGGPFAGREVEIGEGPPFGIGRSRDNDLVLPEDQAATSARHAEIQLDAGQAWITDRGSSNGTFVNGARVTRSRLRPGDRVSLGGGAEFLVVSPGRRISLAASVLLLVVLAAAAIAWWVGRRGPSSFEGAADRAGPALYLVVVEQDGRREPIGTAFAVTADGWLATNAHVAVALEGRGPAGERRVLAVRNDSDGSGGAARRIVAARIHRNFRPGSFRDDVALVRLEPGAPIAVLPLAGAAERARVKRGTRLASYGFPAAATDPARPRARLREHMVGDERGGRYVELGSGIAPGFSGGPVLDLEGRVVALVVGGDFSAGGGSWGISVAAVEELLAESSPGVSGM